MAEREGCTTWRSGDRERCTRLLLAERGTTVATATSIDDGLLLLAERDHILLADPTQHRAALFQLVKERPDLLPDYRPPAEWRETHAQPPPRAAAPMRVEAVTAEQIDQWLREVCVRTGLRAHIFAERREALGIIAREHPEVSGWAPRAA